MKVVVLTGAGISAESGVPSSTLLPSEGIHLFDEARHGPASLLVPGWVEELSG